MSAIIHVGVDATTFWNERGFGRFTRELLRALVGRPGYRYTLLVDREPRDELPPQARVVHVRSGATVTEAAVGEGARSPRDLLAMSRAARRECFDVFFFPAVYSYFPLLSRVPCVVAFHDTIAERFPALVFPTRRNRLMWRVKVELAKRQATRAMTVSHASASDVEVVLGIPRDRIDLVTEGPDPIFAPLKDDTRARALRARYGVAEHAQLLVYVGGLNPHKNLLSLLRAMPAILRSHPDTHLVIVGDTSGKGFYDNAKELIEHVQASVALHGRVSFTGYVTDEELVGLYNGASALVFPSLWEGFGLPAVEAMACGVPVLASRRGSLPEVVGGAGLYFEPEDPADIARATCELLGDAALRERLARAALARASLFSWQRGAELAEQSFKNALAAKRRARSEGG